ncbi:transposase, IS110 family [Klebsiella oxytoca]|nr:transposase, IS110 family [Klebsiella oxytoca]
MSVSPATTGGFQQSARDDIRIKRLLAIEGMGPVVASALVAAVGDGRPVQERPGNGGLSGAGSAAALKRRKGATGPYQQAGGTRYVRTLIIHGARAVLNACQNKTDRRSQWLQGVSERRNRNIATVALANKNGPYSMGAAES